MNEPNKSQRDVEREGVAHPGAVKTRILILGGGFAGVEAGRYLEQQKRSRGFVTRIIDDAQAALPSDSWSPVGAVPHAKFIRSISYHNWKSGARIDVDLVAHPPGEAQALYSVGVWGWKGF